VSFGVIPGRFLGVDGGTALVLECCDGFVDGVEFQQASFPSTPFIVPPEAFRRASTSSFTLGFLLNTHPPVSCRNPRRGSYLDRGSRRLR
jgi:hypothetical protein